MAAPLLVLTGVIGIDTDAPAFTCTDANSVFVDASHGDDTNSGTKPSPKLTINGAIGAAAAGKSVCVATGNYNEGVAMASGVSVYGQYDSQNGWAHSTTGVTLLSGSVRFYSVSGETHFERAERYGHDRLRQGRRFPQRLRVSAEPRTGSLATGVRL